MSLLRYHGFLENISMLRMVEPSGINPNRVESYVRICKIVVSVIPVCATILQSEGPTG